MNENESIAFYAFLNALGTTTAAIGSTPTIVLMEPTKKDLGIIGNALQAAGSGLQADISEDAPDIYGNGLQAMGNTLVIYGLMDNADDDNDQRWQITGNWFQALGGSYSLKTNFDSEDINQKQALTIVSTLMQVIGNSLQAVSGAFSLREVMDKEDTDWTNASGSWIQAVGALLEFLIALRNAFDQHKSMK